MKRIIAFFLVIMIIVLGGCIPTENDEFSGNRACFEAVTDFARFYYAENYNALSGHATIEFHGGGLAEIVSYSKFDLEGVPDDVSEAVGIIESIGFEYLWVSDSYVIYWKDDLKTYGLLWSASPMKTIKETETWYSGMKYHKLENEWYEIGTRGV